jgi:hypothetical protein
LQAWFTSKVAHIMPLTIWIRELHLGLTMRQSFLFQTAFITTIISDLLTDCICMNQLVYKLDKWECCMTVCLFLLTLITEPENVAWQFVYSYWLLLQNQRMLHDSLCDILVDSYYKTQPENVAWQFVYSYWLLLQNQRMLHDSLCDILVDSYYRTQPENVACQFVWYSCWLLLQNTTRECCMTVCLFLLQNQRMLHDSLCDILVDSYYKTQPENVACQFVWYSCWLLLQNRRMLHDSLFILVDSYYTTRECCMPVCVIILLTLITKHNQRMLHDSSRECCMTVCVIFLLTRITEHNQGMLHASLCDILVDSYYRTQP